MQKLPLVGLVSALLLAGSLPAIAQYGTSQPESTDKGPGSSIKQPEQQPEMTEEQKAKQSENEQQRQQATTRNQAIEANNKGVAFQSQGNNAEAITAFQDALQKDPTYDLAKQNLAAAHYNLALEQAKQEQAKQDKQDWTQVIANLEAARSVSADPAMQERTTRPLSIAYHNQAAVLLEAKQVPEAVTSMEKAVAADSSNEKYKDELTKLKASIAQSPDDKPPAKKQP